MKACLTALYLCAAAWLLQGMAAEPTEADRKLFRETKAKAEKGDVEAQFDLGIKFVSGEGVQSNDVEAVYWIRKAAELGHAKAQFVIGIRSRLGLGVPVDEVAAVKWFRKAAEQGHVEAQFLLASMYAEGRGVAKDEAEAAKWYRKAAEQGYAEAQNQLGVMYGNGGGVAKDEAEAVKWYRKAAEQDEAYSQLNLGLVYSNGRGVVKNAIEAAKWYRRAAEQGLAKAQFFLGLHHVDGRGVLKDWVESYKWWLLSAAQGDEDAKRLISSFETVATPEQRAEGQRLAREFKPRKVPRDKEGRREDIAHSRPKSSGTGFFITDDGYMFTNQHVAGEEAPVRLLTAGGLIAAKVVKVDKANDLALLKAEGKFTALPVITSRGVRLGATAATVGFPNTGLQGFAPKLAKGEIASLAGAQDDARHFQISAPIQPGNSGGALVDERGNVIGVVVAKLSQRAALATSGALAENVNYAVKSSYLLSFLESVPEVAAKLKDAHTKERKFEDVVKAVEQATVLVLVY